MKAPEHVRRPAATVGVASVVVVGLLAGCGSPPPEPVAQPAPAVVAAALTVPQTEDVLAALGQTLEAADADLDSSQLPPRLEGPAMAMRRAEYVRASATDGDKPPTVLPTKVLTSVVPQTTSWARTQLAVTEQPDDLQAQRILVLRQGTPRSQYRLWGWARLMPGAQMPTTALAEDGSEVVPASSTSLLVPPGEVLTQFTDVLAKGSKSDYAKTFEDSPFQQELEDLRDQADKGVGEAGSASSTYEPLGNPAAALRTIDGGAIVAGAFTAVSTISITLDGAKLPLSDPFLAALAGATSASKKLTRTYTGVVVLYVPPEGSDASVQVLAGELVMTEADAS